MKIEDDECNGPESDFDVWWREEGSEIHQLVCENDEQYVKRIARIAWENGEYKERHRDYRS